MPTLDEIMKNADNLMGNFKESMKCTKCNTETTNDNKLCNKCIPYYGTKHCSKCKVDIVKRNWTVHTKSKKHITGVVEKLPEMYHCKACNYTCINGNKGRHIKTKKHCKNIL